jgi:TPR repeat protein
MMKRLLFIFTTCLLLCACGTKQEAKQTQYTEEEYVIRGSVLQNPDSMDYYAALANEGDARALYVMAASYYCNGEVQPLPVEITRVRTRHEADSLLSLAAEQGYKPAIKTRECFKECRGEE